MDIMKIFTILLIITIVILIFNLIKVDTNKNIEGFYKYVKCTMINEKKNCKTEGDSTCKWTDSNCEPIIKCDEIQDANNCDDKTEGICKWEEKRDDDIRYIDGCKKFNEADCENTKDTKFKDKCIWGFDEFTNENTCKMKDGNKCWDFFGLGENEPPTGSTCVPEIQYDDKCVSIRGESECDEYKNANGVKICKYQSEDSGGGMPGTPGMPGMPGGTACVGLVESNKKCSTHTTKEECSLNNCKWDKGYESFKESCINYDCSYYSNSGIKPPAGSSCEKNVGDCKIKSNYANCWDNDIASADGKAACTDNTHCKIGGNCHDTKDCFTEERGTGKAACEKDSKKCKWVGEGDYEKCEDITMCYSETRSKNEKTCEGNNGQPGIFNCNWEKQCSNKNDNNSYWCQDINIDRCEDYNDCEINAVCMDDYSPVVNPKTPCEFYKNGKIDEFGPLKETCMTKCKESDDTKCTNDECVKLCRFYDREYTSYIQNNEFIKQKNLEYTNFLAEHKLENNAHLTILDNVNKQLLTEQAGIKNNIGAILDVQQNNLDSLIIGMLPDDIGVLLDKEEYLLRSLDSMGEKSIPQSTTADTSCDEQLNSANCPKTLVSRYNRTRLNLNYVDDDEFINTNNVCLVTINLNYNCNDLNEAECNKKTRCNFKDSKCSPENGADKIQKLKVNILEDTPTLAKGVNGNKSNFYFILRKICNKKQYIDLYDQYTTDYFVANPNIDYDTDNLWILQPKDFPNYTLHIIYGSNGVALKLDKISGNKNEQFE